MQSIFRFPGGKSRPHVKEKIQRYFPTYREYREPFVGGGGLFFEQPTTLPRWINDINPHLMEVYKALQERPETFIAACRAIEPEQPWEPKTYPKKKSKGKQYNARLKAIFDSFAYNEQMDQALRYFFINRTVYAGRVTYDPKMASRMYFSVPEGWNIVTKTLLEEAAECMKGVRITCGDFAPLLLNPGDDVLVYCDPPYMRDTELTKTSKLYSFGFSREDHERMAQIARECPHKLVLSYDDHPFVRSLYENDFHIFAEEWIYCGSSEAKKKRGAELVITNFLPDKIECSEPIATMS